MICHIKAKDFLNIFSVGLCHLCVTTDWQTFNRTTLLASLKTDFAYILLTFMGAFISARDVWRQTSHAEIRSSHSTLLSLNFDTLNVIINLLLAKNIAKTYWRDQYLSNFMMRVYRQPQKCKQLIFGKGRSTQKLSTRKIYILIVLMNRYTCMRKFWCAW